MTDKWWDVKSMMMMGVFYIDGFRPEPGMVLDFNGTEFILERIEMDMVLWVLVAVGTATSPLDADGTMHFGPREIRAPLSEVHLSHSEMDKKMREAGYA